MTLQASVFFASPDLSLTPLGAAAILLAISLFPLFILTAFKGLTIMLGLFQFAALCVAELVQWRLTLNFRGWIKVASATLTYMVVNVAVTVGVIVLGTYFPHAVSYLYGFATSN